MQYARAHIDPVLGTDLGSFMNLYLKVKYAKQPLTPSEAARVQAFALPFFNQVKARIPAGRRFVAFLNPLRTLMFFIQPGDEPA